MNAFRLRLPTLLLLAVLTAGTLAACQTAERAVDEAGDVGEAAYDEVVDFFSDETEYLAVDLGDTEASGTVTGVARFARDEGNGEVVVQGRVEGLAPGLHGFHVHENGDCAMMNGTPAGAAGGHYNPDESPHGAPNDPASQRHVGDFGNIRAGDDGVATFTFSYVRDEEDFDELEDRAVLVHGGRDDLRSQPSGDAGSRKSCGVLTDAEDVDDAMLDEMNGGM